MLLVSLSKKHAIHPSRIHSFHKHFLSTYYMPDPGIWDHDYERDICSPSPKELATQRGKQKRHNQINK